jgi:hypothetical protein
MLSMMARGFFSESSLLILPIVALFIFMAVFTLVTIRILRADKESIHLLADLPFADEKSRETSADWGTRL